MRQINFLLALCLCLLACGQKAKVGDTVTVEPGVEIPIAACVEANGKILGNSVDPVTFCKCLIPKFYQDLKNDPEKLKLLKEGNWYDITGDKQEISIRIKPLTAKLLFVNKPNLDVETIFKEVKKYHANVENLRKDSALIFSFPDFQIELADAKIPAQCLVAIPDEK
jgi:hypothetical protein